MQSCFACSCCFVLLCSPFLRYRSPPFMLVACGRASLSAKVYYPLCYFQPCGCKVAWALRGGTPAAAGLGAHGFCLATRTIVRQPLPDEHADGIASARISVFAPYEPPQTNNAPSWCKCVSHIRYLHHRGSNTIVHGKAQIFRQIRNVLRGLCLLFRRSVTSRKIGHARKHL